MSASVCVYTCVLLAPQGRLLGSFRLHTWITSVSYIFHDLINVSTRDRMKRTKHSSSTLTDVQCCEAMIILLFDSFTCWSCLFSFPFLLLLFIFVFLSFYFFFFQNPWSGVKNDIKWREIKKNKIKIIFVFNRTFCVWFVAGSGALWPLWLERRWGQTSFASACFFSSCWVRSICFCCVCRFVSEAFLFVCLFVFSKLSEYLVGWDTFFRKLYKCY